MDSRERLVRSRREWALLRLGSDSAFDPGHLARTPQCCGPRRILLRGVIRLAGVRVQTWRKYLLLDTQSECRTVPAGIFCTGTLAETETRLFRTALHAGAYRVVPAIPGKKSDIGRKKNTGQ